MSDEHLHNEKHIENIPNDVVREIFSFLNLRETYFANSLVCKSWNSLLRYDSKEQWLHSLSLPFFKNPQHVSTIYEKTKDWSELGPYILPEEPEGVWLVNPDNVDISLGKASGLVNQYRAAYPVVWDENNNGFYFDGSNGLTFVADGSAVLYGDGKTFSAWIKCQKNTDMGFRILSTRSYAGGFEFVAPRYHTQVVSLFADGSHKDIGSTQVSDDKWHHVAVVMTNTHWKAYVDGVLDGTQVHRSGAADRMDITNIAFGRALYGEDPFLGYMKHIAIWNSSLTDEQIETVFKVGFN
jgi:hypothetical protein